MGRFFKIVILLVLLIVAAAVAAPFFIPTDVYKAQIIAAVERQTGRTLTIDGDVSLTFFPTAEFVGHDVTFSNAPGASDPLMARMDTLTVAVDTMGLLSRRIEIQKLILEKPTLFLEVMKNQKANWEFEPQTPEQTPAKETASTTAEDGSAAPAPTLSFGDMRIIDGALTYRNQLAGEVYQLSSVDTTVSLPDLEGPFSVKGDLVYKGEEMDIDLALGSIMAIASGQTTPMKLDLSSRLLKAKLDGTLTGGKSSKIEADAKVSGPSLRRLAAWVGQPITIDKGFEAFDLAGKLYAGGSLYTFSGATVALDKLNATGSLAFKTEGSKPTASGRLDVNRLDLRPYQKDAPAGGTGSSKGLAKWSEAPLDLSALKALNANFAITTNALFFQNYEIGKAELDIQMKNNTLTANLKKLDLYQGAATGTLTFDVSGKATGVDATFSFSDISAGPLLQAATAKELVEGIGNLSFTLNTKGVSQKDLMKGLNGSGELKLRDGKLLGADLNRMLTIISALTPQKAAADGETQTAQETGTQKATDFVEMGGTFKIKDGVLKTKDFLLVNEALSLMGNGGLDIGRQSIDMRLVPGQRSSDGGTKVALKVEGGWDNIKYGPDFETAIKDTLKDALFGTSGTKDEDSQPSDGEVIYNVLDSLFSGKKKKDEETTP